MTRLLLLLTLACTTAFAAEPTLVVPPLSKPSANPAEADALQARYDAAWTRFEEAIGKATAEVTKALDAQFEKAADAGNLELADMWDKKKKFFLDTKTIEWPSDGKAKVEWRKANPNVDFPDDFSEVVESAQQAYAAAVDALKADYEALVKDYTKARNLERAKQVREEMAVLDKKPVAPPQRPRVVEEKPRRKTSLTLLQPRRNEALNDWFAVNRLPPNWKQPCKVVVGGKECATYLFAHAASRVVYDLPTGAKRFTATGVCPRGIPPDGNPQFVGDWLYIVQIDGQEVYRQHLGQQELQIAVDVPTGAKTLALIGDPNGRNNWDCVVWAYPTIESE